MKVLQVVFFLIWVLSLEGQLIFNGSMEKGNTGDGVLPSGWSVYSGTPDCCTSDTITCEKISYKIPICSPDSGKWVRFFFAELSGNPYRETFGQGLREPIFQGKEYTLSYYGAYSPMNNTSTPSKPSGIIASFSKGYGISLSDTFNMSEENTWFKHAFSFVADDYYWAIRFKKELENYNSACYVDGVKLECTNKDTVSFSYDTLLCAHHPFLFSQLPKIIRYQRAASFLWDNGDSLLIRKVDTSGTYWVQTDMSCRLRVDTFHVKIMDSDVSVKLPIDTLMCVGDSLLLDVTVENPDVKYEWTNGDITPSFLVLEPGYYGVKLRDSACVAADWIWVDYFDKDLLASDSILCVDPPVSLEIEEQRNTTFVWSNGSELNQIEADEPGFYWVEATNHCGYFRDSVFIGFHPIVNLGGDVTLCDGDTLVLDVSQFPNYRWAVKPKGVWTPYHLPIYNVTRSGYYSVEVWADCQDNIKSRDWIHVEVESCESNCSVYLPNVFSPNYDSYNDGFVPQFPCLPNGYHLTIFDRWGNNVFDSTNYDEEWNGELRGQKLPAGVYVYILKYKIDGESEQIVTGDVTLIR